MRNMLLAAMFASTSASAQTKVRVPISGHNAIPGFGAAFYGARLGAPLASMRALSPGMQMPVPSALALIPTLAPTPVLPAPAAGMLPAAAKTVEGSPLAVIRDVSANEAQKTAALDRLFENSAPSSPEALEVSALPAAAKSSTRVHIQSLLKKHASLPRTEKRTRDEQVGGFRWEPNAVQKVSANTPGTELKSGGEDLSDKNDPTGPNIKLFVYQTLVKAGLLKPVTDVRDLMKPGAEADLLKRGFKRKDSKGIRIYFVVPGSLGNTGQRVAYFKDGSVGLTSVIQPGAMDTLSMQNITLDAAGSISNITEYFGKSSPGATAVQNLSANEPGNIGPFPATEYTNLKAAIKARGVKAALAMQASRTRREGRYWFTVNILGTGDDFKKIENLFEKDSNGWSYAGIPTDIQLRGTPVDPAASAQSAAASGPKSSKGASPVPEWFDSSGLSFTLMKKSADGLLMAVLRHGRYELGLFLDKNGDNQAIFTKYALNPMGTPLKEEVSLRTEASRRAVAKILRAAQAENPVQGKELAALKETLAYLDGDGRAGTFKSAAVPESYTWLKSPRANGAIFTGAGLPTVSAVKTPEGPKALIDGQPVTIDFLHVSGGPTSAIVVRREGETITVDLGSDPPALTGTLSGEIIWANLDFDKRNIVILRGRERFRMTLAGALELSSLQAGDVPEPVRRFAAYMLILRSVIGSWR